MFFRMFLDYIRMRWMVRDLLRHEMDTTFARLKNHRKNQKFDNFNSDVTLNTEETKRALAIKLLLAANGDENEINNACDLIKELGLIKNYQ